MNNKKIVLVEVYDERIFYENTGIHRIAAFLENHHQEVDVKYIKKDINIDDKLLYYFNKFKFVGFAVYDINLDYIIRLTKAIKQMNSEIIVFYGSQYVTLTYQDLITTSSSVDFLVLGDGEYPVLDFVKNYSGTNKEHLIKNNKHLVTAKEQLGKVPCFPKIQDLPWPKHYSKIIKENLYTYIQSSNGCLGDCTFCARIRRDWSFREPEDIIAEIKNISREHNIRAFIFADSNFGDIGEEGKQRIHRFLDLLEKENERYAFCAYFRAEALKDKPTDRALLKRLRKNGFIQAFIGIESGSPRDLNIYRKRATMDDNREILSLLRQHDIEPLWGFMMFNPYSNEESLYDNYNFLTQYNSYVPVHFINHVNIYKNTQIYNMLKRDNLIIEQKLNNIQFKFQNKFAEEAFTFFQERYFSSSLFKSARNIRDATRLYLYLSVLVDECQGEENMVKKAKKELAILNKQFFKIIYVDYNLMQAARSYDEYAHQVKKISDTLEVVKMVMIRKYYSKYGL